MLEDKNKLFARTERGYEIYMCEKFEKSDEGPKRKNPKFNRTNCPEGGQRVSPPKGTHVFKQTFE